MITGKQNQRNKRDSKDNKRNQYYNILNSALNLNALNNTLIYPNEIELMNKHKNIHTNTTYSR